MADELIEIAGGVKVRKGTTVYDAGMKSVPSRVVFSRGTFGYRHSVDCEATRPGCVMSVSMHGLYVNRAGAIRARITVKRDSLTRAEKTVASLKAEVAKLTKMLAAEPKADAHPSPERT